jgi:hypothetical protein
MTKTRQARTNLSGHGGNSDKFHLSYLGYSFQLIFSLF